MSVTENNMLPGIQKKVQSLCIPRIPFETTKNDIFQIFNKINIVRLERVDILHKKSQKGDEYKMAFLYFKNWYDTPLAHQTKDRILSGKDIKLVYAFPWFWKITADRRSAVN
jgi:hypothetical protein